MQAENSVTAELQGLCCYYCSKTQRIFIFVGLWLPFWVSTIEECPLLCTHWSKEFIYVLFKTKFWQYFQTLIYYHVLWDQKKNHSKLMQEKKKLSWLKPGTVTLCNPSIWVVPFQFLPYLVTRMMLIKILPRMWPFFQEDG